MDEPVFEIEEIPDAIWAEPPKDGERYPKLILSLPINVKQDFLILGCEEARMILQRERSDEPFKIFVIPYKKWIRSTDRYIRFYTPLTDELYDQIESFRAGENLRVYLKINQGLYLLPHDTSHGTFTPVKKSSSTSMLRGNLLQHIDIISYGVGGYTKDRLLVTRDQWNEKVLKQLGMGERFIVEIPCELPDMPMDTDCKEINDLKDRLTRGANLLRKAVDEYNTAKDVDKCVDNVRRAADLLHNISKKEDKEQTLRLYAKYLIEKSSTGSDNISEELINDIFKIIDAIFNISSKGPHETKIGGARMEYCPKYEDAEMLLNVVSLIYSWMLKKFERQLSVEGG